MAAPHFFGNNVDEIHFISEHREKLLEFRRVSDEVKD